MAIQESAPDVEAYLVGGMQSGSISETSVRGRSIHVFIVQYDKVIYVSLHKITEAGTTQSVKQLDYVSNRATAAT
jgi:hypothetical protein